MLVSVGNLTLQEAEIPNQTLKEFIGVFNYKV